MTITATCSCCGRTGTHELTDVEQRTLDLYKIYGRNIGRIQDLFPHIPAWIRSGVIDLFSGGFCICPKCSEEE